MKLNIYKLSAWGTCHSCNYHDSWRRLFSNHHHHHTELRSSPTRTQKNMQFIFNNAFCHLILIVLYMFIFYNLYIATSIWDRNFSRFPVTYMCVEFLSGFLTCYLCFLLFFFSNLIYRLLYLCLCSF